MKGHGKFAAFFVALLVSGTAAAQTEENPNSAGTTEAASSGPTWRSFPNERHIVATLLGGGGLRLNDAWGAGTFLPTWFLLEAHYLLLNVGNFHIGPSLGAQIGLDPDSTVVQWAIQPGVMAMTRPAPSALSALAITARIDVPILVTGGPTGAYGIPSCGPQCMNISQTVFVPQNPTSSVTFGIEAGVGAAYYFTAGIAATIEINGGVYFGDAFYAYPYLGAGLGVLIDYELLP